MSGFAHGIHATSLSRRALTACLEPYASAISTVDTPIPKASMVTVACPRPSPLAARPMAPPRVGPMHGDQTAPSRTPTPN